MDVNRIRILTTSLFVFILYSLLLPLSIQASSRGISVVSDLSHKSGKLGAYRALIIGINDYQDPKIPDLETAINDANAMAELLHKRYGFQVKLLLDSKATRRGIFQSLRKLASSTKPNESVLIYYAGHGDLDRTYNDGWWVPFDAKGGDPVTYLDNVQVQKAMRSMKARHVLLISDSCYSGTMFGKARAMPKVINDSYYLDLYNEKSRWGMTSGNKTPVSDAGSAGHSVFAYHLLKELEKNEKPYISTQELYTRIAPIISNNSEQTPVCRPIINTGDHGGEFVFVASMSAMDIKTKRLRIEQERKELERLKMEIEREKIALERKRLEEEKRALKAKSQNKQLAYIPPTAIQDPSDTRLRLAVFPFCESALEDSKVKDQKEFTDFVIKFTKKVPNIILTHSFYPYNEYETDDRPESIKKIIPKKIVREIWYGNSRFPRKKPDYDVLKKLGEKINSDLILTFKVVASATHTNQLTITYNGYLIDIEKNIYYERKNYKSYDDLTTGFIDFGIIKKMTKKLFGSYQKSNPISGSKEIGWDARFIADDNGIVLDTATDLEWIVGPDKLITWYEAKSWAEGLNVDGGGWRMPTLKELGSLYKKGSGAYNRPSVLEFDSSWVWSGEAKGSKKAWTFDFNIGGERWATRVSGVRQPLAVRSRK